MRIVGKNCRQRQRLLRSNSVPEPDIGPPRTAVATPVPVLPTARVPAAPLPVEWPLSLFGVSPFRCSLRPLSSPRYKSESATQSLSTTYTIFTNHTLLKI